MTSDPPIRPPHLDEAAAFVAAVEEGSLARAGRRLGISQPAMTKRIRTLETLVGLTLLERTRQGVRPTEPGRGLLEEARRLLEAGERFHRTAAAMRGGRPLRVAVIYTLAEACVARWIGAYRARGEPSPVEVRVGHPDEVRGWVADGVSDLGFAAGPASADARVDERPFAEDRLVAVVPAGHALVQADPVALADLVAGPLILREPGSGTRRTLDDAVADAGLPPIVPALTLASTPGIRAAVLDQGIPGILSRLSVDADRDAGLACVAVRGDALARRLTVVRKRGGGMGADQARFLAASVLGGRSALAAVRPGSGVGAAAGG
jgi:DNA-binding transcriptional LysR family regulator